MKRFALIGYPVAGSLSPRLFQAAYQGRYTYDLIEEPTFPQAWARFLDGYDGINVTAPYKQDAFAGVDQLSEAARLTGAVNLVVKSPDGLLGNNTDVDGITGAVRETGLAVSDALVVGAGGAARAAIVAALQLGCRVRVTNRTYSRAQELSRILDCEAVPSDRLHRLSPDLVIYTLPSPAPVPEGLPLSGAVVLEAEYKHPSLDGVPCRAYISGRRWLLWQAVAGYSLFTGEEPDVEKMSASL